MANQGQPTIGPGATGEPVRRAQRALRRTANTTVVVDGDFGPQTEVAVKEFQQWSNLPVDGMVGPSTWAALPDGGPMPMLSQGSQGAVVSSLQKVLAQGAPGGWGTSPGPADGIFGPATTSSVQSFQAWGGVPTDGAVGDQTWDVSLRAAGSTLETAVGLNYVIN